MGMGYQGFVAFYTQGPAAGNKIILLTTGGAVNLVLEQIYSSAVLGWGWYNAPETAHYADGALRYEGSVDIELQGSADTWDFLGNWAINERAYSKSLDISPDGAKVQEYHTTGSYLSNFDLNGAWCTSLNISSSPGSFLTSSVGILAINRNEVDPDGGTDFPNFSYINQKQGVNGTCAIISGTNPLNPNGNNVDPIPFWKAKAELLRGTYTTPFTGGTVPQAGLETVDWSVDITNNTLPVYVANGTRFPTAILQGAMSVGSNVTLFHNDGIFDPILGPTGTEGTPESPYLVAENSWFRVTIPNGVNDIFIEVPAVVVESDDYGIKGQNDFTTRAFTMKGLGGRCNGTVVMPPAIMSDNTGAFVAP